MSSDQDSEKVPKRVEEALFYRLKQRAFKECDEKARAYADCCRGRILSLAWACRKEAHALSGCMSSYTSRLDSLKRKWVAAGRKHAMSEADWNLLLDELVED